MCVYQAAKLAVATYRANNYSYDHCNDDGSIVVRVARDSVGRKPWIARGVKRVATGADASCCAAGSTPPAGVPCAPAPSARAVPSRKRPRYRYNLGGLASGPGYKVRDTVKRRVQRDAHRDAVQLARWLAECQKKGLLRMGGNTQQNSARIWT